MRLAYKTLNFLDLNQVQSICLSLELVTSRRRICGTILRKPQLTFLSAKREKNQRPIFCNSPHTHHTVPIFALRW